MKTQGSYSEVQLQRVLNVNCMSGLRWPEPIYMRVVYVFQSRSSAEKIRDRAASFRMGRGGGGGGGK